MGGGTYLRLAVLTALIALAAVLLGGPTADAQTAPTSITLVSNTGQMEDATLNLSQDRAALFETGHFANGYILTSVKVDMNVATPSGTQPVYTVKIFDGNAAGFPDNELATLNNPNALQDGLNEFSVSGNGLHLHAGTFHHIVISISTDGSIGASLSMTQSDDEDEAQAGWSTGNSHANRSRGATNWTQGGANAPKISVHGFNAPKGPPVVRSAAVKFTNLTITFNEDLDENSVPPAGQFQVNVTSPDPETITVQDVDVSGNTVALTLARAVRRGMTATVSYTPPSSNPLQEGSYGIDVAQFTGQRVTNTTPTFEPGAIYEAVGGLHRVVRDENGRCIHESRGNYSHRWRAYAHYGSSDEDCRRAVWNAYRLSIGEDLIPGGGELPAGSPPALTAFTCPSGWERSTDFGQQHCTPRGSDMGSLSPERAREFVRRGLRPSDANSTNPARYITWFYFMSGPESCGEGMQMAYSNGGNGPAGCTPVSDLVNCAGGNLHGASGRACAAPAPDYNDFNRYPRRADPTVRINSTVGYSNNDPNDRSTREYGAPGCMAAYWDDEKGGWVCKAPGRKVPRPS